MAEVHVTGLKELQGFLGQLPAKLEKNVVRGALRAGATKELLQEARAILLQNGSVRTGTLMVGLKVVTSSKGGVVTSSVKATGKHAFVAHWLEYGVGAHAIAAKGGMLSFLGIFAKSVWHPGFRPKPFMRPALDHSGQAAVVATAEYMRKRLATKHGLDTADIKIAGDE